VTIRTEFFKPEKGRYLHPSEHRPITHREAARLMGFPDDFVFVGTKTEIARQIGNAVPPDLAGALAGIARDALGNLSESVKFTNSIVILNGARTHVSAQ
jgi:DNA (cytosine-5)-methyltransferase 1